MSQTSTAPPLSRGMNFKLSTMMFLQYGIWGAWLPLLYPFLLGHRSFTMNQCAAILAAGAAGAIFGPFIAGQIADRHFPTEKFLALSHFLGAILVWFLAGVADFNVFLGLSVVYGIVYAPTLALTNSLAFHHLPDRDRDFGRIRVWGTVGWIVVGIAMGHWLAFRYTPEGSEEIVKAAQDAGRADAFKLSALMGFAMAAFCLILPHTPPSKGEGQKNATFEALQEVKRSPLLLLFLLAVPISIIHQFYFVHTAAFLSDLQRRIETADVFATKINSVLGVGGVGLMTIGQMTEIVVLACIPLIAKKVSRKTLLGVGLAAYAVRMALFAYTDSMGTILLGVALHGLCFGCFIFVAFMVVDEETSSDIKASAQNLFNLVIVGIGIIVGSWFSVSLVGKWATHELLDDQGVKVLQADGEVATYTNYTELFSVPMWIALACLVVLLLFYPGGRRSASKTA